MMDGIEPGSWLPCSNEPVNRRSAPGRPVRRMTPSRPAKVAPAAPANMPSRRTLRRVTSVRCGRTRRATTCHTVKGTASSAAPTWSCMSSSGPYDRTSPALCSTPVATVTATRRPSTIDGHVDRTGRAASPRRTIRCFHGVVRRTPSPTTPWVISATSAHSVPSANRTVPLARAATRRNSSARLAWRSVTAMLTCRIGSVRSSVRSACPPDRGSTRAEPDPARGGRHRLRHRPCRGCDTDSSSRIRRRRLPGRSDETCVPPRRAPSGGRADPGRVDARAHQQPRHQRVRVPHVAGTQLVTPPHHRGDVGHQRDHPPCEIRVAAQHHRSAHCGGHIRNRPAEPAAHLVPEQPRPSERTSPDGAFGNDTALAPLRPHRRHLHSGHCALDTHHEGGVEQLAARPVGTSGGQRLVGPTAPPDESPTRPRPPGDPVEVDLGAIHVGELGTPNPVDASVVIEGRRSGYTRHMATTPAVRRRVMVAADEVQTTHPREAAILGGIVRSTIDGGRVDVEYVRRYASAIIAEFNLVNVDRRPPGSDEIAMVLTRFEERYGPPFAA